MNADRIISLICMLIGSVFYYQSYSYPDESTIYVRFILGILMVLSVLLFINSKKSGKKDSKGLLSKKILMAVVLTIAYVVIMPIVGYYVATFAFLVTFMWIYNHNGLVKYLAIAALFSISVYLFFEKLLTIWFPKGFFM